MNAENNARFNRTPLNFVGIYLSSDLFEYTYTHLHTITHLSLSLSHQHLMNRTEI